MKSTQAPASEDLVSTGYALVGEATANLAKAPVQLAVLWLATLTPLVPVRGFWELVVLTLVGTAFATALSFCASRAFEVQAGRSSPGGWGYALVPTILEPVGGFFAGWVVSQDPSVAVAGGVAFAIAAIGFFFIGKPWIPGPSSSEIHTKIQETKSMTKEHFAEDVDKIRAESRRITKAHWEKKQAKSTSADE